MPAKPSKPRPSPIIDVDTMDAFNAGQHRAQRLLALAQLAIGLADRDHSGELDADNEITLTEHSTVNFNHCVLDLLEVIALDMERADRAIQEAWSRDGAR